MTKTLKKVWHDKVMEWVHALWLSDWDVVTILQDAEEYDAEHDNAKRLFPASASTFSEPNYHLARIIASRDAISDAAKSDPEELNRLACHEVVHMLLSRYDSVVEDLLDALPSANKALVRRQIVAASEYTASHLERVLSQMRAYSVHLEQERSKLRRQVKTMDGFVPGVSGQARRSKATPR